MCFMKTRLITVLSAIVLLAVSCEEDPNKGSVWEDPKFARLIAPTEKVLSNNAKMEIYYKEGQLMKVWERNGNAVNMEINKDKDSVFFSYDWIPDAVPAYVAFPSSEDITCTTDGTFGLTVASQQKVSGGKDIENFLSVGKVTGANRTSYKVSPVRNVTGFVAVKIALPAVKSIVLESPGGEPMTGKVSVDCEKLEKGEEAWFTVVDGSSSVTLAPAEEGKLLDAGTYYASVLPGNYSQGLKVTVNYKNGQTLEKVYGETGLVVSRSAVLDLDINPVDSDLIAKLPDDIRIDLDFSKGWPFVEEIVSADRQTEAGFAEDMYSYKYGFDYEGSPQEFAVQFLIKGNNKAYAYDEKGSFQPGNAWSNVAFPSFPEHYLRAVRLKVNNSQGKTYLVNEYEKGTRLLDWTVPATKDSPSTLSFPTKDGIVPVMGTSYKISFKEGGAVISTISLLYSRELPSKYDANPFGDELVVPDDFSITLDFAAGWPFKENCVDAGSQTDEGEKYTYEYNYEYDGTPMATNLDFSIVRSGRGAQKSYEYMTEGESRSLHFVTDVSDGNSTAMINFPVIPGRYVKEIRAVHNNSVATPPRFNITQNFKTNITAGRKSAGEETVFTLPYATADGKTTITPELNQTYSLRMRDKDMNVTKVVITYSKTKPE